jgi:hypothetical protein
MWRNVLGVPRSENRTVTWWTDSGVSERKSQNMSAFFVFVAGSRFWVWMKSGNLSGSRMKKTGVLFPVMS